MHLQVLPILAAAVCSLCNGSAAILQKISADKQQKVDSLNARFLIRLLQDVPYIVGVTLDIIGFCFTIYAVHYLPLFLVEAIIASNIIITACIERIFRHQNITKQSYGAILLILLGLVVLALSAKPHHFIHISHIVTLVVIISPVPIALVGFIFTKSKKFTAAIGLAVLGGLAFGGTSVIGRIFTLYHPFWHNIVNPLLFSLIASGSLGILLFSVALQRAQATVMNATMTASQTLIPAIVGIIFLGDEARNGLWPFVIIGSFLALSGVLILGAGYQQP
ncbi:MAG: hypothetical protein NVSMB46_02210 [Candidatus Saccharimonadales bacterium]